jgi:hypothetical protein
MCCLRRLFEHTPNQTSPYTRLHTFKQHISLGALRRDRTAASTKIIHIHLPTASDNLFTRQTHASRSNKQTKQSNITQHHDGGGDDAMQMAGGG